MPQHRAHAAMGGALVQQIRGTDSPDGRSASGSPPSACRARAARSASRPPTSRTSRSSATRRGPRRGSGSATATSPASASRARARRTRRRSFGVRGASTSAAVVVPSHAARVAAATGPSVTSRPLATPNAYQVGPLFPECSRYGSHAKSRVALAAAAASGSAIRGRCCGAADASGRASQSSAWALIPHRSCGVVEMKRRRITSASPPGWRGRWSPFKTRSRPG